MIAWHGWELCVVLVTNGCGGVVDVPWGVAVTS
jgi:hypothetical protein